MTKTNPKPTPASRPNARKPMETETSSETSVSKIVFGRHGAPSVTDIKAGGKLVVEYDAQRSPIPGGVTAFIEFKPSGKRIEAPAVGFKIQGASNSSPQPFTVPVAVDVPRGTTTVSMWFRQYQAAGHANEAWDSNFGRNYNLEVKS